MPEALDHVGEDVAGLMADVAVEEALPRNHGEVAVRAAVERTAAAPVAAGALQVHRLAHEGQDVGGILHLLDDLVGNEAHGENSAMVTPVPPCCRGREVELRHPAVALQHPPHPLPHHAGSHAMNDAKEGLLRQHRGIHRGQGGALGLVAGHAPEVHLHYGLVPRGICRGLRRAVAPLLAPAEHLHAVGIGHHAHRADRDHQLAVGPNLEQVAGDTGREPHALSRREAPTVPCRRPAPVPASSACCSEAAASSSARRAARADSSSADARAAAIADSTSLRASSR